jgi:glycosyltransferase involved in cell wall biosynthesis
LVARRSGFFVATEGAAPEIAGHSMSSVEKPRVAFCLESPVLDFGGTEVLVAELVRRLADDFAITLVSRDRSLTGTWIEAHVERHIAWSGSGEELARRLREAGVALAHFHCGGSFAWEMRRLGASPILRVRAAGIRCLTTNHGFFSPLEGYCAQYRPLWMKLALFPAAWLSKTHLLGRLECEVAVSRYDERALRHWYWPRRRRFRQIYHSQLPSTATSAAGPRARRVLCVGTIGWRKGQPLLAKAFALVAARFPDWELLLAGRIGAEEIWRQVEEIIASHGLARRMRRVEGLTHAEVAELMRESEIFVLPSLFEGLGLALQEALYHGCACVSTRSGGPEDFITDGENGLLVRNEDPVALAQALCSLMGDGALRERLRSRGPASVLEKGMTAAGMAAAYRGLYRELLS